MRSDVEDSRWLTADGLHFWCSFVLWLSVGRFLRLAAIAYVVLCGYINCTVVAEDIETMSEGLLAVA